MEEKKELFLEDIEKQYYGQWVLLKETSWDENGHPVRGIVVAHDEERGMLVEPARKLHSSEPETKTFTFFAGPKIPEGLSVVL